MRCSSATRAGILQSLRKESFGSGRRLATACGTSAGARALLGILWLAISAFNTIGGVILYILANTLFAHLHELGAPQVPTSFLRPLLSVLR
ncbi:MAG: hypothetical protein WBV69_02480 [Candidatus Sulfotelmatobacter sp.]